MGIIDLTGLDNGIIKNGDKHENFPCNNRIYNYWGKTQQDRLSFHLLVYHCLDVAAVGQVLLQQLLQPDDYEDILTQNITLDKEISLSLITFYLTMHDLGKFSERFQKLRPDIVNILHGRLSDKPYVKHDELGFCLWQKIWPKIWQENWLGLDQNVDKNDWQDVLKTWFQSVTMHHDSPQNIDFQSKSDNLATYITEESITTVCSFVEEAAELLLSGKFKTSSLKLPTHNTFEITSRFLQYLTWFSDRKVSSSKNFPPCSTPMPIERYWHKFALPQAKLEFKDAGVPPYEIYKDHPIFFKKIEGIDLKRKGVTLINKGLDHISNNRNKDAINCYVEASKLFEKANAKHLLKKCKHQLKRLELNEERPEENVFVKDYCFSYPAKTATSDKPTNKGKISQEYLNERFDRCLFENLRSLRRKLAEKEGMPPFFIFYDLSLEAMATYFPKDLQSLRNIEGVDEKNLKKYGELFIKEIVEYCEQYRITENK